MGAVDPNGPVKAIIRTPDGRWTEQPLKGDGLADDHDNPAFLQLTDGRVLAFYARHGSTSYMVAEAGPDLRFGEAVNIAPQIGGTLFSYANPVLVDGRIALFYRCGRKPDWTVCRSDSADGRTWSKGEPLLISPGQRPYFKLAAYGSRVDFVITDGHPNEISPNAIRHFYLEGGRYFASDGSPLGPAPIRVSAIPKVAENGWLWDIKPGLIAYTDFDRYYLATWDRGWHSEPIAASGPALYPQEAFYRGGIAIKDADTLYTSDGSSVYLHRRGDGWKPRRIGQGIRPYVVGGGVAWLEGAYRTYTDFDTRVVWKRD